MKIEYKCLKNQVFKNGEFTLKTISEANMEPIRNWRNSQIDVLRQNKILTESDQSLYYKNIILPDFKNEQPRQLLFGLYENDKLIGYGGLVHIAWTDKRAEVSFLLDDRLVNDNKIYKNCFLYFLKLISMVAFDDLNFNRIFVETFNIRDYHISIIEEYGFVREGVMREHVIINNKFVDSIIHGYLKSEYNERH